MNKAEFAEFCARLESGETRVVEKVDGKWRVNPGVKENILEGFRLGVLTDMEGGFVDKDTLPARRFSVRDGVRMVPGGSSVRAGAHLAKSVIVMPPAYINIGAFVDEGTMIDSHALVGSCAYVGKRVHLAAASQLGGVLEPVGALPVIVEDDVFIGGNCGIYEGTIVESGAVLATGVVVNASTPVYDAVRGVWIRADASGNIVIPRNAVVVPGSRPFRKGLAAEEGLQIYCPIIVKYRDSGTSASVALEDLLRR